MPVILTAGPIARASNGVIGKEGGLPWRLKTDLKHFKALTLGKPVIMGRKTWESLRRTPLVGRLNLVLTRDGSFEADGAVVCEDFSEAISIAREQAQEDGVGEVCVIGGVSLFEIALPRAQRIYLTEVHAEVEGDAVLPAFDESAWTTVAEEHHRAGKDDDHPFTFRVLERRRSAL